ncbi:chaplin [Actinomadura rubrisoli]|uniref:Chaplin n=1 Tax=Actinomadura rubrisoli TaxID=2530368 RepID=A0A4R5C9X4_9ACTN|nr:chaplin [Actinomadura rubrisoli]TDD93874.1 chaplin [Actinomadura rubrisoli]
MRIWPKNTGRAAALAAAGFIALGAAFAPAAAAEAGGMQTSGTSSALSGNQLAAPISAPVSICGNSAAVVGLAKAWCKGGAHVVNGGHDPRPSTPKDPAKPVKPRKASKHRPAAGHHKLPSTTRSAGPRPDALHGLTRTVQGDLAAVRPGVLMPQGLPVPKGAPGLG